MELYHSPYPFLFPPLLHLHREMEKPTLLPKFHFSVIPNDPEPMATDLPHTRATWHSKDKDPQGLLSIQTPGSLSGPQTSPQETQPFLEKPLQ